MSSKSLSLGLIALTFLQETDMAADTGNAIYESQLLRASHSRNCRRYSQIALLASFARLFCLYRLARPISVNSLMQARLIHGCRPGLS